jgi:hypothetical protein
VRALGDPQCMAESTVLTVSRDIPAELQRQILHCAITAVRQAGATGVATSLTKSSLIVSADVTDDSADS